VTQTEEQKGIKEGVDNAGLRRQKLKTKKVLKIFGETKMMFTFAAPFDKSGVRKENDL
jgi:acyl-[acyl carrier protein]--UDP-N-acetylglucosamine O-acyltransferase